MSRPQGVFKTLGDALRIVSDTFGRSEMCFKNFWALMTALSTLSARRLPCMSTFRNPAGSRGRYSLRWSVHSRRMLHGRCVSPAGTTRALLRVLVREQRWENAVCVLARLYNLRWAGGCVYRRMPVCNPTYSTSRSDRSQQPTKQECN